MHPDPHCIFCKIVAGQIPSKKVYEDEQILAFHDIHPWAPVHILVIPKLHIASMVDVSLEHQALMGRMLAVTPGWCRSAQGSDQSWRGARAGPAQSSAL